MHCSTTQRRNILFLLFAIPFLLGTGVDLYVPSLPMIANYFHVKNSFVQLTISSYMLGYALGQVFLGVISDGIGRRKILLLSAVLFTGVSFLAVLSPNIWILNLCRLMQGVSVGGLAAVMRAVAPDCFKDLALTRAITYIATSWALGPIIGPAIGGYLQHYFNWQADFYFFGIYGLFIFVYLYFAIPETNGNLQPLHPRKIYQSMKTVSLHPVFFIYSIVGALIYSIIVIFNVVGPFLVQVVLKYSVVAYGHIALILGGGYFSGCFLNQLMLNYFKPTKIARFGIVAAIAMSMVMLLLGILLGLNLYIVLIPTWLIFCLCGFVMPNISGEITSMFTEMAGTASAVTGFLVAGGVFVISAIATGLKTYSQIPMATMYVGMLIFSLSLFFYGQYLRTRS